MRRQQRNQDQRCAVNVSCNADAACQRAPALRVKDGNCAKARRPQKRPGEPNRLGVSLPDDVFFFSALGSFFSKSTSNFCLAAVSR